MEDLLPVLVIWAGLCAVLIGYVAYRFVTDRGDGSPRHRFYPLVSRSTDPTVPPKGAWLLWAAYVCLLAVPASIVVALASEVGWISAPFSGGLALAGLALGLSLLALAKRRSKIE
jgi:hypothetical protein